MLDFRRLRLRDLSTGQLVTLLWTWDPDRLMPQCGTGQPYTAAMLHPSTMDIELGLYSRRAHTGHIVTDECRYRRLSLATYPSPQHPGTGHVLYSGTSIVIPSIARPLEVRRRGFEYVRTGMFPKTGWGAAVCTARVGSWSYVVVSCTQLPSELLSMFAKLASRCACSDPDATCLQAPTHVNKRIDTEREIVATEEMLHDMRHQSVRIMCNTTV